MGEEREREREQREREGERERGGGREWEEEERKREGGGDFSIVFKAFVTFFFCVKYSLIPYHLVTLSYVIE